MSKKEAKNILITRGAGFIGSQVVIRFVINYFNKEWLDNASSVKYKDYYLAQYGNK